jgi:hypothetical protein
VVSFIEYSPFFFRNIEYSPSYGNKYISENACHPSNDRSKKIGRGQPARDSFPVLVYVVDPWYLCCQLGFAFVLLILPLSRGGPDMSFGSIFFAAASMHLALG